MRKGGERSSRRGRSARRERPDRVGNGAIVETIALTGDLGSHALEALQLEIRRLAHACGLEVREIRIETAAEDASA